MSPLPSEQNRLRARLLKKVEPKGQTVFGVSGRLTSLDAFRGATVAAMILVNNPGSWSEVYPPLQHAAWHGWTLADLIFPFFLFIMGVTLPIALGKQAARGVSRGDLAAHAIKRSLILFGLGLFVEALPGFDDWQTFRVMGVLQRIALAYLLSSLAYLILKPRATSLLIVLLLLGYWAAMTLVPVPGFGAGNLSPEGNLAAWLDRLILGREHLWRGNPWDPEGLFSTLPAAATVLIGLLCGEWISQQRSEKQKVAALLAASALLLLLGLIWGQFFPINKNLWTSSYVLLTAGIAGLIFTWFYWAIDLRGWRSWSWPFILFGLNAIAVFVGSSLLTKVILRLPIAAGPGETLPLYTWLYTWMFASWAGPTNGSLGFAIAYVLLWLGLVWLLFRRRIFIKI